MTDEEQQLFTVLTTEFPDFWVKWKKYQDDETIYDENERCVHVYDVAHVFAKYLIDLYDKRDTETLARAFREIESVAQNGSRHMSEVALVGFIEILLMLRSHKGIPLDAFDEWLGQSSKEFWYDMHRFFTTGSTS